MALELADNDKYEVKEIIGIPHLRSDYDRFR